MEKLDMKSKDKVQENIEKIRELFPNCVTEISRGGVASSAVDFDKLKQEMSDMLIDDGEERYQMTWPNKRNAVLLANTPISATLRPCKEESVDFDNTKNLYIEGDNLDVLKLLQETYLGKIKMIYIDPPYNTGKDSFVYNDCYSMNEEEFLNAGGYYDSEGNRVVDIKDNNESNGRFHTEWLNMLYTRLRLARDLLTDDGVIFISIDDNEQANLKKICDEIFGEKNFVGELIHQRAKGGGQAKYIVKGHDYILVYAKVIMNISLTRKKVIQQRIYEINGELYIKNDDIIRKQFGKYDKNLGDRRCYYEQLLEYKGEEKKKEVDEKIRKGELFLEKNEEGMHTICRYEKVEDATSKLYSIIKVLSEVGIKELEKLGIKGFSYPKPTELLKQLIGAGANKDSIIIDFFSGSATTAHAVMQLNAEDGGNRKFIMVQIPETIDPEKETTAQAKIVAQNAVNFLDSIGATHNICEIGKERIRRAGKKIKEENPLTTTNLDTGFRVLKLDSSNMKDVYYKPEETTRTLLDMLEDNIKEDRSPLDLLFQVMLDLGHELSAKIEEKTVEGKQIFAVDDNDIIACFDDDITEKVVTEIAKLKPLYAVFRDSGMASDSAHTNFEQIFAAYSPNTIRKVI